MATPESRLGCTKGRVTRHVLGHVDWIGWVSSGVLLLTLGQQVKKQWLSGDSRGVSSWLFAGQLLASVGFATYSYLLENWVFLATNLLLIVNALLGQWVTLRNRRRAPSSAATQR
jgi:MtN3 and saliva related transmembrane protein